uniref:Sema domain-containing protein n=1 Tax=Parascaris equorum TaxID=6256 RepID=A0A914RY84_PAREQ
MKEDALSNADIVYLGLRCPNLCNNYEKHQHSVLRHYFLLPRVAAHHRCVDVRDTSMSSTYAISKVGDGEDASVLRFGNQTTADYFRLLDLDGEYLLIGARFPWSSTYHPQLAFGHPSGNTNPKMHPTLTIALCFQLIHISPFNGWQLAIRHHLGKFYSRHSSDQEHFFLRRTRDKNTFGHLKLLDKNYCPTQSAFHDACHNFVRVLAKDAASEVLVCGTNAFQPMCRQYDREKYGEYRQILEFSGLGISPYDPSHNSTFLRDGDVLYAGTVQNY